MESMLAGCMELIESNRDYVTDMENCEFTYEWTIRNFREFWYDAIESPIFSSHYADFNDKWILKFYPYEMDDDDQDPSFFSVELQLKSFNYTSLKTKCKISIDNKNEITMEHNFCKFGEKITWNKYISETDLIVKKEDRYNRVKHTPKQYNDNNDLKIRCTITMPRKLTNSSGGISSFDAKQQLIKDWKKLLLNEKSADVTIQVGQKSFRAIKGILAVRSPVFAAMFDHEQFKENENNDVVIEDIEEDVFEEFLHYIYTGESLKVGKMPMELLAVAEKYQVNCLKNICEVIICETINVDNVASIVVCSDRYNLKKLHEKCLEFMKKNLQAVISNKTFQVYKKKYPEIFVGVLEHLLIMS
ncbi:speckle-type POZ protein-like [Aphidius gifuensis]|uniref:speckle-type POZ protein-like n=1 Tax=Aphidius gifuensis TaxID=684658 RepID=UPI001CDB925C|nr:speckle-type POZ protein-like [Aphidius gifuensis]